MNAFKKKTATLLAIAALAHSAFAQETTPAQGGRLGAQVRAGLNSFSYGSGTDPDMGYSIGGGAVKIIPHSELLAFSVEANLLYRKLFNETRGSEDESVTEFALSVPATVQVSPMADQPLYLSGGLQIDIPFSSEYNEGDESGKINDRSTFDIGLVLGGGYHVTKDLAVDLKIVIGMTSLTSHSGDKSSLNQYGFGVINFF